MAYYIAINDYRSSTDEGFANTWSIYRCRDRKHQQQLLDDGLPVSDQCYLHDDGSRSECYSTKGIRLASRQEIREATRYGDKPRLADAPNKTADAVQ